MKIGEMSKIIGISEYTLRYYEEKGLIKVPRDNLGRRNYDENEIEWILFLKKLKDTGMLLKDIKRYSDLRYLGDSTIVERMEILKLHREKILEERKKWDEYLDNMNRKINIYENCLIREK